MRSLAERTGPDLSRFVDTPRQRKDPCFHCTLWDCEPGKGCKFIATPFNPRTVLDQERQDLIAELKEEGVILGIRGNGFIEYAGDTETPEDRVRRQKREHMQRVREVQKTTRR